MDENVLRAFTLDESEAFCVVEPFDLAFFAFAHVLPSICCSRGVVEQAERASGTVGTPPDGMHAGALMRGFPAHGKRVMLLRVILYPRKHKKKRGGMEKNA